METKSFAPTMGNFYYWFFISFVIFLAGCCVQHKIPGPEFPTNKTFTDKLLNSVVALPRFDIKGNVSGLSCTGVFISQKHIVTARHCIIDINKYVEVRMILNSSDTSVADFIIEDLIKEEIKQLGLISFITKNEYNKGVLSDTTPNKNDIGKAKVVYISTKEIAVEYEANDIVILEVTEQKAYSKNWLKIANTTPLINEQVIAIGMPNGNPWFLSRGVVSKVLYKQDNNNKSNPNIIIGNITVIPGNSGGPLINNKGEIVGIASAMQLAGHLNQMVDFALFVPAYKIQEFYNYIL